MRPKAVLAEGLKPVGGGLFTRGGTEQEEQSGKDALVHGADDAPGGPRRANRVRLYFPQTSDAPLPMLATPVFVPPCRRHDRDC